ncbi:hypothetical protein ACVWZW_000413 [Bradyrhizobium sp. F1.13.4]
MSTQANFQSWAKERLDEMEATLTFLDGKAGEVQAELRAKADELRTDLRATQSEFRNTVKKHAEANEAAFVAAKAKLEVDWKAFEADVAKYVDGFSKRVEQQRAAFEVQAAAQLNAWREAADKIASDGRQFAAERRAKNRRGGEAHEGRRGRGGGKAPKAKPGRSAVMVRPDGGSGRNADQLRSRQPGRPGSVQTSSLRLVPFGGDCREAVSPGSLFRRPAQTVGALRSASRAAARRGRLDAGPLQRLDVALSGSNPPVQAGGCRSGSSAAFIAR